MAMRQPVLSPHPPAYASRRVRAFGQSARLEVRPADHSRPAMVTIVPDAAANPLPQLFIDHAVDIARTITGQDANDYSAEAQATIRTPALTPDEARGFLNAGFTVRSNLALLTHDLDRDLLRKHQVTGKHDGHDRHDGHARPERQGATLRLQRFRRGSTAALLAVDLAAFGAGWEMDHHELILAETATPVTRVRLATDEHKNLVGFAITGRAGRRGYLQRLAVRPDYQGHGIGTALIGDALRWSRRHNVRRLVVNTQAGNLGALSLYRRLGFVDAPVGLLLLERNL
jgi:ribosomal protein S18 acetylase RimI-like enzyme